ncbi:MAG: hypothetical protein ABI810_10365 [Sphingomonas bacterium]
MLLLDTDTELRIPYRGTTSHLCEGYFRRAMHVIERAGIEICI